MAGALVWRLGSDRGGTLGMAPGALVAIVEHRPGGAIDVVGMPGSPAVPIGPYPGFSAPFDLAAVHRGALYVALGRYVAVVVPGRRVKRLPSPAGRALEVFAGRGALYLLSEKGERAPILYRLAAGRFLKLGVVPNGFPRFLVGRHHPWILVILPRRTILWWPGSTELSAPLPAPETGAIHQHQLLMPDAVHPRRVDVLGRRGVVRTISSPYGLVLGLVGPPVWAATTKGMWQVSGSRFDAWPGRPPAGLSVIGTGPWVLIQEQALGGLWFNLATGRFGGRVHLQWETPGPVLDLVIWPK